ncbi:MAG TPA: PilZ domain-containing protein [Bryobacteraceae bacterium]|nr:PilZ domain-containing protein [Bryobacteraceae bacterium]
MSRSSHAELPVPATPAQLTRRVRQPVRISGKAVPDGECELVGIGDGVLYLRSERRIADTSAVNVTFERTQLSGYVSGCVPVEGGWDVAITLLSSRRREVRIPMGEYLSVGVVGRSGTKRYHCTVMDRSASGLGLRFAKYVAPGTRIYVEIESTIVLGEIRHCSPTDDGYFMAGLAVVECVPDAREINTFSEIVHKLRWKIASGLRGPAVR